MDEQENLAVVIPVYNEEAVIETVLRKWIEALDALKINYRIHVYNDGSKDSTSEKLAACEKLFGGRLAVHEKKNSGHGPTILKGYRENGSAYCWIFQTDSDDEMSPVHFHELWERRGEYDFVTGRRDQRKQNLSRAAVSFLSRWTVRLFYGGNTVWDVNSPYRLMRSEAFAPLFEVIPPDTFAPNVVVSGYVALNRLRFLEINVPQTNRKTGCVSIRKWKLFKASVKSFCQTVRIAFRIRRLAK